MKKRFFLCSVLLLMPCLVQSAPRSCKKNFYITRLLHRSGDHAPELSKPLSDKERDHLMFTNFIGIAVNFVKLLLEKDNYPEAKQNAYNILNGISNLAHVITRSSLSGHKKRVFITALEDICYRVKRVSSL